VLLRFPRSARMISYMFFSARMVKRYGFDVIHGLGQSLAVNVLNPTVAWREPISNRIRNRSAVVGTTVTDGSEDTSRYAFPRTVDAEASLHRRLCKTGVAISKMVKQDIISHFGFSCRKDCCCVSTP